MPLSQVNTPESYWTQVSSSRVLNLNLVTSSIERNLGIHPKDTGPRDAAFTPAPGPLIYMYMKIGRIDTTNSTDTRALLPLKMLSHSLILFPRF